MARDFSVIQKIVDENRRKKMQAPSAEVPNFSQFDKNTIAEYESIPNYNVIERAFDKDKAKAYNTKQRLLDSYEKAQSRETQRFINKNNISDSMLESAFGVNSGKNAGTMGFTAPQSEQSKKDTEYLSSLPGVNMDYLEKYYKDSLNKKVADNIRDYAENDVIGSNLVRPILNASGSVGKNLETKSSWLSGKPMSNNSTASTFIGGVEDISRISKEKIDKNVPDKFKGIANAGYDVSTGVGDIITAVLASYLSGNPAMGPAIMANNAAANSFYDATERGVNPNQVMATGLTNAGAEYVMNLLPFGAFDDVLKGGSKNLVKNIAKQGVSEALEEGTTEAVSTVTDALINKDKSNIALAKQQYMSNGMTEEDATKQALADAAKNVGYSALIGGLSGSTIGGGTTLYNNMVGRNKVDNASELDPLGALNATVEGEQQTIGNRPVETESLNVTQPAPQDSTSLILPLETPQTENTMPATESGLNGKKQDVAKATDSKNNVYKALEEKSILSTFLGKDTKRIEELLKTQVLAGIPRNAGTIENSSGSFGEYVWSVSNGKMHVKNTITGEGYSGSASYNKLSPRANIAYAIIDDAIETLNNYNIHKKNSNEVDIEELSKVDVDTAKQAGYNNSVNVNGSSLDGGSINGENINSGTGIEGISDKRTESGHQYSGEMEKAGENSGRNTGFPQELVVISESNKAKLNAKGITSNEFRSTTNNPELFSFALATARSANKNGVMVSPRSASELVEGNIKTFLSADGLVGGAVEENGNITGVFKNPKSKAKGAVTDIILTALQNGGTKLDCYGEFLLDSYSRLGFEPVARVKFSREAADPDWNYDLLGEPDIYFMKHNGKSIDEVIDDYINGNAVVYSQEYIDSLPYMEYEEAEAYRDSLIPKAEVPPATQQVSSTNANNPYSSTTDIEGENQRVRSYNTTLIEKTDAPQELKNEFIDNPDMYTQLSNAETLTKAVNILDNNDISTAINEYHKLLDAKNPVAVPLGYNISKQLAKDGRLDESVQIVREMSKALTESGQFSQAAAITMLNNNPEAAKRYLVRDIDNLNREGREKFGKKWKDFELTEAELKRFSEVAEGDSEAIKGIYNDVYKRLRKEYPSTMTEKLMEYRRVAMLLNVRTNMRNIVSNALMMPVRWTADRVAALGEGVYSLIDPKYSRTQSLNPIRSKQSKQLASDAFETVRSELLGDNKYEDRKGAVRDKQVFKGTAFSKAFDNMFGGALTKANEAMGKDVDPSLMETARNFTYYLLQKGDDVFVKKNFESRMASYLDAQGITDIENIPPDAYVLATQEALKATFKDDTALSQGLTALRQMFNKAPGGMLGDIVMPFTKTPANLAMRGIDYSPIPAVTYAINKVFGNVDSEADATKTINMLAKSATGSSAIFLGYLLAHSGVITGALSEDKDEAEFQKQQGQLAYSIKTPYGYFSYDWAQPASIPLILGATIYDSQNNGTDLASGLFKGFLAAADSWLELSPLQNMSEIFGGYGTPAENVAEVLMNDFPLSFVPSQLNAIAKTGDRTQRVSYSPDSKDSFINQAKAKIPGMSDDLPAAYDTWGNPIERQDNVGEAFFANFLNPGQFGNDNATELDDDIMMLYESTGNASVFPKKAAWSYKVGGENVKLDNEQYSEFQRIMGSNAFDMADALINSNYYNGLSDEQKAETIKDMYSFADALAKSEVLGYDVEGSDTYKKTYSVYKEKGSKGVALYTSIKETLDGSTNADKVDAVNQFDISDEEKGYYLTKMITLSSAANAILESEGYAGVYKHYYQKALESKVEEMRQQPQGSVTVTQDMVDAVKRMRGQSSSNTQVTPEMIEAVRKMRSGM